MSGHDDRRGFVFTFPGLGRGGDDVVVTPPRDTPPRDGFVRMHPSVASFLVRDWALARDTAADLDLLSREAFGRPLAIRNAPTGLSRTLQPLVDAFEAERLVVWGPKRIGVTQPAVFPSLPGPHAPIEPATQTTWIEIVLLDQDGVPVADEPYTLVLPDGGRRSGQLDERGFARVEGIVAGVCDVSFPRIDGREWDLGSVPFGPPGATRSRGPVGLVAHVAAVAARSGFRASKTLLVHPDNAELRASRPKPEILSPEDEIAVPAPMDKTLEAATGRRHAYATVTEAMRLILRFQDAFGRGRAALQVACEDETARTDGDGIARFRLQRERGDVDLGTSDTMMRTHVGALLPIDDVRGVQRRLVNLGYLDGLAGTDADAPLVDRIEWRGAVEEFQLDAGVKVTGDVDGATVAALLEAHGC